MYHIGIWHWNLFHNQTRDTHSPWVQIFTEFRSQIIRNLPVSIIDPWDPDLRGCCFSSTHAAVVHVPETEWLHAQRQSLIIPTILKNLVLKYCISGKYEWCQLVQNVAPQCLRVLGGFQGQDVLTPLFHKNGTGASSWIWNLTCIFSDMRSNQCLVLYVTT